MFSSILFKSVSYSFARKLHQPHVRRFFNRNPDNVYKAKEDIQKKLQVPTMPENLFKKIFQQKPKTFIPGNKINARYEQRIKFVKTLSEKYTLAKVMQTCLYSNRYILFKMTDTQIQQLCEAIENNYGFTQQQITKMFTVYYRTINPKLLEMIDQRIELFHDYLQMQKQQTIQLFAKHPFLIPASKQKIKETILLLLSESRSLGDEILSKQKIIDLLHEYPEMFILGRFQLKDLVEIYKNWGMDYKQVWKIVLQNPVIMNNLPYEIMPLKRRLFRYFQFTKEMGILMIKKYPLVLLSSVSSLEAKLIFIKDRLKLPINEQTLELLQYKFSAIRPRGELLVRAKETVTLENIIEYIKMSDEQFAKKLDIPVSRVKEENERFRQTDEVDWRKRKVLVGSGVQQKVKGIIQNMRESLTQQTATEQRTV